MKSQMITPPIKFARAKKRLASAALTVALAASLAAGAMTTVVADRLHAAADRTAKGLSADQKIL
ncbi:MAG TPA: hypothetical protein VLU47_04535, partial [Blastocatellia bacterium]|nr:hypothetical protein [Blastocatellia bacterium]